MSLEERMDELKQMLIDTIKATFSEIKARVCEQRISAEDSHWVNEVEQKNEVMMDSENIICEKCIGA